MNDFWMFVGGFIIGLIWFLVGFYSERFIENKEKEDDTDYDKNHDHIKEIIEICLENDRIRYEDLVQIDILDPTTDEFKFELISRFCEKLNFRVGEIEIK